MSGPIHPRTVIAAALVAKLRNPPADGEPYPTQVGANVEHNWPFAVMADDLPKIILWAEPEDVDGEVYQGVPLRVLEVSVGILADGKSAPEIDQLLDSIALEVERAVLADSHLYDDNGWAWTRDIKLTLAADKDIGPDKSSRLTGGLGMKFRVEYAFTEDVTDKLDRFLTFHSEIVLEPYLHPDEGRIDAEGDVDFENTWEDP